MCKSFLVILMILYLWVLYSKDPQITQFREKYFAKDGKAVTELHVVTNLAVILMGLFFLIMPI